VTAPTPNNALAIAGVDTQQLFFIASFGLVLGAMTFARGAISYRHPWRTAPVGEQYDRTFLIGLVGAAVATPGPRWRW
jgi:hypothetical protein